MFLHKVDFSLRVLYSNQSRVKVIKQGLCVLSLKLSLHKRLAQLRTNFKLEFTMKLNQMHHHSSLVLRRKQAFLKRTEVAY